MPTTTYAPTSSFETVMIDGKEVDIRWWEAPSLSPLPDAANPRFPRRLDYDGRADGGWLELGRVGPYDPCACCMTGPCLPQCPVQRHARPDVWERRWRLLAEEKKARGEEVATLYADS